MCLASCPNRRRPRRRPSSSAVIRVVGAKLPPLAFSGKPPRSPTDEDEQGEAGTMRYTDTRL